MMMMFIMSMINNDNDDDDDDHLPTMTGTGTPTGVTITTTIDCRQDCDDNDGIDCGPGTLRESTEIILLIEMELIALSTG